MRITGGRARGIPLQCPPGKHVRPAMDRTREAVFSSLGESLPGKVFADLFAGTGAYGLEALSRGARDGVWIEKDRRAIAALRRNLAALARAMDGNHVPGRVIVGDALSWKPAEGETFGLIFADPPFPLYPAILPSLLRQLDQLLDPGDDGRIVLEGPGNLKIPEDQWRICRRWQKSAADPAVYLLARPER